MRRQAASLAPGITYNISSYPVAAADAAGAPCAQCALTCVLMVLALTCGVDAHNSSSASQQQLVNVVHSACDSCGAQKYTLEQ